MYEVLGHNGHPCMKERLNQEHPVQESNTSMSSKSFLMDPKHIQNFKNEECLF